MKKLLIVPTAAVSLALLAALTMQQAAGDPALVTYPGHSGSASAAYNESSVSPESVALRRGE